MQNVSRRSFIGGITAATAGLAVMGGMPLGALATEQAYTPGTYTATKIGRRNPITVETEFSSDSIVDVRIVEANETPYISEVALETIPADIVKYQSLGIDTVTGATLTSFAILSAVADCVEQAGGDVKALEDAPGAPASTEVVDIDADIVICGAGASGMAAAVAAAQSGAQRVVVLEKTSNMGGNCLVSGGYLEYINPPEEMRAEMNDGFAALFEETLEKGLELGVPQEYVDTVRDEYDAYYADGNTKVFDSDTLYAIDYVNRAGGTFDTWVSYAPMIDDLNQWLTDMGFEWTPCCAIVGFPWPRQSTCTTGNCGEGYFNTFSTRMEADGLPIEILAQTPATELIVEDGVVTGVVGQCDDGTVYNVRSKNGVILATGGFSGNPDMLKQYNKVWNWDADTIIPTTNAYGHSGDAITMTKDLGAMLALLEAPMCFPYSDCKNFSTETIVGDTGNCLIVNTAGQRFVNETLSREEISAALMEQDEPKMFIITDSANCLINDGITQFGAEAEKLIEDGHLFRADSLEELAELVGIDPEALVNTVADYNGMIDAGADPQFGRTVFTETSYIRTAPFYASPRTWAAHITIGGLATDPTFRVVREDGTPIEGLYCVGEAAAGFAGIGCMCTGMTCARMLFA